LFGSSKTHFSLDESAFEFVFIKYFKLSNFKLFNGQLFVSQ